MIFLGYLNPAKIKVYSSDFGQWTTCGPWPDPNPNRNCRKYPADATNADKLLSWNHPEIHNQNYWLAPDKTKNVGFIIDLVETATVKVIFIVNTQNGFMKDRGTKKFKVFLTSDIGGVWEEVLNEELEDSRKSSQVKPSKFKIKPTLARFAKFVLVDYWGNGGGLQYFTCLDDDSDLVIPKPAKGNRITMELNYLDFL